MRSLRILPVLLLVLLTTINKASASHIFGADFFYTHLSGNTYTVTLWVYADCSGAAFPNLINGAPEVEVINGGTPYQLLTLTAQAPTNGLEVTPVCAQQLNNTTCTNPNNSIQGVKKFVYSGTVTLNTQSANWRFLFNGTMGNNSQAGRSNSITNILNVASGSLMVLEATLNNIGLANSSPTYTTIPTPFFAVNKSTNYNSGAVDPGDSLVYALVPALHNNGVSIVNVSYNSPLSATQPIAVATGTYSFSTSTGQLSFTPNQIQNSVVVYKVSEYRNGILRGTSMREMTFVVLNNGNNPPAGSVNVTSGGVAITPTSLAACQSAGNVNFTINPTDADGDNINVQWSGLPAGASLNVTGNNTTSPQLSFSWNVTGVTPGSYTFFVTYTDNGCALSSKQTQAYTVIVQPTPTFTFTLISPATCTQKAAYQVTHNALGTWKLRIYEGMLLIDSTISALPNINDSLPPGTYTFRVSNASGCFKDTTINIVNPTTTIINLSIDRPTCNNFTDGAITAVGTNSTGPYQYALGTGAFSSSGIFSGLGAGSYTIHVKDQPGCVKDTTFTVYDSLKIITTASLKHVLCNGEATGEINTVASGGHGSYKYFLNILPAANQGLFTNLIAGPYTLRIEDGPGCYLDTNFTITQPTLLTSSITPINIDCYGNATGSINIASSGGVQPHVYSLNNAPFVASGSFGNLVKGTYFLTLKDSNNCLHKDTVTLTEPPALYVNSVGLINPRCTGDANGVILINVAGGSPPFTYAANALPFQTFHHITDLPQGTYVVHIKDANGCVKDSLVTLVDPAPLSLDFSLAKALCFPLANGSATLKGVGGTPPYQYAVDQTGYSSYWTTYYELRSGQHKLYVKDTNQCVVEEILTLGDSLAVNGGLAVKQVSCFGLGNGEIVIEPTEGFPPYRTSMNDMPMGRKFAVGGLKTGKYFISIKDTVGCRLDTTVAITQPDLLEMDTTVTHSNCYTAGGTGSITVDVTGGTQPYTYTWSTSDKDNTNKLTGLRKGNYYVRVNDANNCRDSAVVMIEYTDCCTPLIANAFTPNGDGRNDKFRVVSQGEMQLKAFVVFNRYGQQVFSTSNINDGWDGTMNGTPAEVGTYFYHIKASCGSSGEHAVDLKGDIILVR